VASVEFEGVEQVYDQRRVIHGVDLVIDDGSFCAMTGPAACGKSSLLRLVAGLESPAAGQVLVGGEVLENRRPARTGIAMVLPGDSLFAHLSAGENIAFGVRAAARPVGEIDQRVRAAAGLLGIEPFLSRQVKNLSDDHRLRTAIARALACEPQVCLFDDPLSGLDERLQAQLREEIRRLHRKLGITSIYATRDPIEAMALADQLVVMGAGWVAQSSTPMQVYDRPASTYVANFVGKPAMNMLRGVWLQGGVMVGDARVPVRRPVAAHDNQPVLLGIRPQHFTLSGASPLAARLSTLEFTGAQTTLQCVIADQPLTVVLTERVSFEAGAIVRLTPEFDLLHVFDLATGDSLTR
jgi:multiple sugar transport system ATP-binding protein